MIFSFRKVDSLPRLAWCAIVTRQDQVAVVYHGPDVEVSSNAFFEGAWDGEFNQLAFDKASVFIGSGAILRPGKVVFSTDTGVMDWIYSVRVERRIFVSNSMAFLFSITEDKPDPAYPYYCFDLTHYCRMGLLEKNRFVPTALGRKIRLHWACNLELDASLQSREQRKPAGPEPDTFTQYIDLLTASFARLADNAANAHRTLQFTPLSALSKGYDSSACAALVSSLGYKDGYTFQNLADEDLMENRPDDSGIEIGRQLGMNIEAVSPTAYRRLQCPRDDEFCANPVTSEVLLAGLENHLQGRLQVSGRNGDFIWEPGSKEIESDFIKPNLTYNPGTSFNDFRLRVGFLRINLPEIGACSSRAIHRISISDEMRPWRIGGNYDRPIPRRILEERGIARDMFGMKKMAGGSIIMPLNVDGLSPRAREDYDQFDMGNMSFNLPGLLISFAPTLGRQILGAFRLPGFTNTLAALKATLALSRRAFGGQLVIGLYTFHWGIERLRDRYRLPKEDDI